jgi:predicted nucleic acid-binding protein
VHEEGTPVVRDAMARADMVTTCAIAYVEARAAFVRRRRAGHLSGPEHRRVVRDFEIDWSRYGLVDVSESLIREAAALAEAHGLRAYDAVHLASARIVAGDGRHAVVIATWDAELEAAAVREGLASLRLTEGRERR